ncbi:hypothetical protein ABPG72_002704 [Tetrahymena utriculariae]
MNDFITVNNKSNKPSKKSNKKNNYLANSSAASSSDEEKRQSAKVKIIDAQMLHAENSEYYADKTEFDGPDSKFLLAPVFFF